MKTSSFYSFSKLQKTQCFQLIKKIIAEIVCESTRSGYPANFISSVFARFGCIKRILREGLQEWMATSVTRLWSSAHDVYVCIYTNRQNTCKNVSSRNMEYFDKTHLITSAITILKMYLDKYKYDERRLIKLKYSFQIHLVYSVSYLRLKF